MRIFPRIIRLCRADLHGVIDQLEDKELLFKQYLREMDESLRQKEELVKSLKQSKERFESKMNQCNKEIEKTGKDLDLAVKKEKDDIARMLIRRRFNQKENRKMLRQQEVIIENRLKGLSDRLENQRYKYEKIKVEALVFNQNNEQAQPDRIDHKQRESIESHTITDQEIELELLQVKEAIKEGGSYE